MKLIILGAGGYGQTVADVAQQLHKYDEILFLDDNSQTAAGKCGDYTLFSDTNAEYYPAFGNNEVRLHWIDRLEKESLSPATLIHPRAYVSPRAQIGLGTVILPGAAVSTDCRVGRGCILNFASLVDHGCILEDGVHICLGAIIKAENRIPSKLKIEAGAVVESRTYPL